MITYYVMLFMDNVGAWNDIYNSGAADRPTHIMHGYIYTENT